MPKEYRRKVWINGVRLTSPRFKRKADADAWYDEMKKRRQMGRYGITQVSDKVLFFDYATRWIQIRMKTHPEATWKPDEQRLRKYLLPAYSSVPIDSISRASVKNFLRDVKIEHNISTETVTRIKALFSIIMNDALEEDPPLVHGNPVAKISLRGEREGKKIPDTLESKSEVEQYLNAAAEIDIEAFMVAYVAVSTGLRKSELIGLQWQDHNHARREITVRRRLEQASNSIRKGTKSGTNTQRVVPIPESISRTLVQYKAQCKFKKPTDFVFCREEGKFISPRVFHDIFKRIGERYGKHFSAHKLRHTFGRIFIDGSGNQKALQLILGHTSSSTTDLYSEMTGKQIGGYSETMNIDAEFQSLTGVQMGSKSKTVKGK